MISLWFIIESLRAFRFQVKPFFAYNAKVTTILNRM